MKFTKKTLAIAVALAIVLTSISIAVFAVKDGTITARTDFSYSVDGGSTWIDAGDATEFAKKTDADGNPARVKADVHLTSDFVTGPFDFVMEYTNNVLVFDTANNSSSGSGYNLSSGIGVVGTYKEWSISKIGKTATADCTALKITSDKSGIAQKFTDDKIAFTVYFTVNPAVTADSVGKFTLRTDCAISPSDPDGESSVTDFAMVLDESLAGSAISAVLGGTYNKTYINAKDYNLTLVDNSESLVFGGKTTFDANGGAFSSGATTTDVTGFYGDAATAPAYPTRDGYTPTGWAESSDSTTAVTAYELGTTDSPKTYYAIWDGEAQPITYIVDGVQDSTLTPNSAKTGATITLATKPSKDGYTYTDWALSDGSAVPTVMPAGGITVYSNSTAGDQTINYYVDGTLAKTETYKTDDVVTAYKPADKAGYGFDGWYTDAAYATKTDVPATMPANTVNLYGRYVAGAQTITYYLDDVATGKTTTAKTDETFELAELPVKDGYKVTGWTLKDSAGNVYTGSTMPAYNLNAYATSEAEPQNIEYYIDGVKDDTLTVAYKTDDPFALASKPADNDGKTYSEWTVKDKDGNVYAGTTMPAGGLKAYSTSEAQKFTVTFKNEDGTIVSTKTDVEYGTVPTCAVEPTKASTAENDYVFAGWKAADGTEYAKGTALPAVTADATYTAYFTPAAKSYTITFTDADGKTLQSSDVTYGDTPVYTGTTPTKASDAQYNYTFDGWEAPDGTVYPVGTALPAVTGATTYKPHFAITANVQDTYMYVVKDDDGTEHQVKDTTVITKNGTEGATYEIPAISVPEGYETTDTQWTTADGTAATGTFAATGANYRVVCTPKQYTFTVTATDGTVLLTQPVTFGSTIPEISTDIVPAERTNADGATEILKGWSSTPAGYEPGMAMPACDITLTPVYEVQQKEYKATFYKDADKTQYYTAEDVNTGEIIPDPGTPKKFGYVFAGWENADGYTVGGQMPAQNIDFTAKWEIDKTLIAIVVGGAVIGGGVAAGVAASNAALITGASIVGGIALIGGGIYLAKNTHTVTYYVDGEVYKTFYVIEGTKVITPSDPTKDGYTFAGWDSEIPDAMPDHDISFNAQWVAGENAAVVDSNIPDTGSATAGISALAVIASAAAAAYVISTRKKDED